MAKPTNKTEWASYVVDRSDYLWNADQDYRDAVDQWMQAWKLEIAALDVEDEDEGKAIVIANDPYNIIKLLERLLGGGVRHDVVPTDDSEEVRIIAEKRELWLDGYWNRLQMETGKSVRREMTWWAGVAGRMAVDVRWVKEVLPEYYKDKRLPVQVRSLDPRSVLIQESEFGWPLYGIHRYESMAYKVRERWGEKSLDEDQWDDDTKVIIHDYWDEKKNIVVCSSVGIEERAILKYTKDHEYPRIPFVYAYADSTPLNESAYKGLSILHPILELWKTKSGIESMITTGIKYHFWPLLMHRAGEGGSVTQNLDTTPGSTVVMQEGETIEPLNIEPDVRAAELMHSQVNRQIVDATFPPELYGQAPSVEMAGFALANLSSAARGRVGPFKEPMEWALAQACELLFGLVESRGNGDVEVWGDGKETSGLMLFNLKDAKLEDHMPIKVTIKEAVPKDEQQMAVLGLQQIEAKVLSRQSYRDLYGPSEHAELEEKRVLREEVILDEAVQQQMIAEAWLATTGEEMPSGEPEQGQLGMVPGAQPPGAGPVGVDGMAPGGPPPMVAPPMGMAPPPGLGVPPGMPPPGGGGMPPPGGAALPPVPPEVIALVQQGVPPEQAIQMVLSGGGAGMPPGMPGSQPMGMGQQMPGVQAQGQGVMPGVGVPAAAMAAMPPQPPPGVMPNLYPGGPTSLPVQIPRPQVRLT